MELSSQEKGITKIRLLAATPILKGGVLRCSPDRRIFGIENFDLKVGVLDPEKILP
jgi:hypothetical protein